jgi:putative aldouronate transport system substrate-binding protein
MLIIIEVQSNIFKEEIIMKVGKRFIAVITIVLLAACVSACTNNAGQPSGSSAASDIPQDNKTDDTGRAMVGNMYVEGLPVLKEKETFHIAIRKEANSKNTMAEKAAVIAAEEQTNIHIEWNEIPYSGWDEKVNILMSSGDLPDAFSGHVDVMKFIDACAVLNDAIEKYAPNIKEMFKAMPELKEGVTAPDGNIYCLPTNRFDKASAVGHGLWINKAWLDNLGLGIPETTDEFVNVLRAFKENDPNKNGKPDEFPLGAMQENNNTATSIDVLFGPFGVVDTPEYAYVKDDKVIFTGTQDGYLEGLRWMHQLYSEGLLEPEVFTLTGPQYSAKAQRPDLTYGAVMQWLPDSMDPRYGDDYIALPPLKGPSGQEPLWSAIRLPGGEICGFTITVKCSNPAALVRYYDNNISSLENLMLWYNGPAGGGQWKMVGDKWMETTEFMPEGVNPSEFERTVAVGPPSIAYLWSKYDSMRQNEPRVEKKMAANDMYLKYAIKPLPNGLDDPERVSQRNLLFVDIDNYMRKFKANAVVQGITDAEWEKHLETCKQLKVDEYVSLWQQYYDNKK